MRKFKQSANNISTNVISKNIAEPGCTIVNNIAVRRNHGEREVLENNVLKNKLKKNIFIYVYTRDVMLVV